MAPWEIIVVDNGSTDDTASIAEKAGCRVISCEKKGAGPARNAGAKSALGDYLAFIDSDVILEDHWIETVLPPVYEGGFAIGLSPVIPVGEESFFNRYRKKLGDVRYEGAYLSLRSPGNVIHPIVNTAACIYRKDLFQTLGGFDERLYRLEDTEMSERTFAFGGFIFATNMARAHVQNDKGILSYLRRSFILGRAKVQLYSLNQRNPYLLFWRDRMNEIDRVFSAGEIFFFYLNQLLTFAGMLTQSLLGTPLPNKRYHPALKQINRDAFCLTLEKKRYILGDGISMIRIDDEFNFVRFGNASYRKSVSKKEFMEKEEELRDSGLLA